MIQFRLIERNDGKFQYEYKAPDDTEWYRNTYILFNNEDAARAYFFDIMQFTTGSQTKRVVAELGVI